LNEGQPYLTVSLDLGKRVNLERPELFRDAQFYAVIIPLASSLLLIVLTFVLGKYLFSDTVGLMAALMIAMNPIDIMTAQKVWADDSLGVFLVVGVLLYFASRRYDAGWMAFLGGVSCGYAVLLKQTGGFILPALIAYHVWLHRKYLLTLGGFRQILYEKFLFIFLVGLFITSAPWFFTVYQTYGNPIYTPYTLNLETATTDWVKTLLNRPPPIILYGVGIPYLMPLFVFFYPAVVRLGLKREDLSDERVFLVLWVISFLGMFMIFDGREHRYMLPAYPAIAVLSASFIDWARVYLNERFTPYLGNGSCAAMFVLTAIWSVPIGMSAVLNNYGLILIPF
jgi:4-amino-4-deoxy-L-arabinose transferase-like glycosyltransferase